MTSWPCNCEGVKLEVFTNILSFQIRVLCISNYEINLHLSACWINPAGCALPLLETRSHHNNCYTYYLTFKKTISKAVKTTGIEEIFVRMPIHSMSC